MDIQNLASEMGLKCITTYKLDALKAVRCLHDSSHVSILCSGKDNISVNVQSHDKLNQDQESSVIADKLNGDKTPEVDGRYIIFLLLVYLMFKIQWLNSLLWIFETTPSSHVSPFVVFSFYGLLLANKFIL